MPVDRPNMHSPQVDKPSPPQWVHDYEDKPLAGPRHASTEGGKEKKQLGNWKNSNSHPDPDGTTSLIEAVLQSSAHETRAVLENERVEVDEKEADPNAREDQNRTPFFWAASRSQLPLDFRYNNMIVSLLRARADPSLTDDQGNTPLAVAAATGNLEFVKQILSMASETEIGIDIDIGLENKDADGYTALSLAAKSGHCDIVRELVESGGANINTLGNEETSPLMCAAAGGSPECLMSRQRNEPKPPQCQKPNLKVLTSRLGTCSFWNKVLPDRRTFLSWAVEFGDEEIVKLLLDLEADPDICDTTEQRMTPLIKALKIGNMAIIDLLYKKGNLLVHILAQEAGSPSIGEREALELARKLRRKYGLAKKNPKGQNPVHIACQNGNNSLAVEFLHPRYCDKFIHCQDNSGKTPLQYAIEAKNEDLPKLLIEHGVSLDDVPTAGLFELRQPNPHCVQLTRTTSTDVGRMRLLLVSDYDEAREPWNPQSGEVQLRLFKRGSRIPEFRTPELKEDLALNGDYCRFFQPKSPSQSGETQMFKLSMSLPDLKGPLGSKDFSKKVPLEIAWVIRELGNKLAYGYMSTLSTSVVPRHRVELLKGLISEIDWEWKKRVSDLENEINDIRLKQVELQGRSWIVLENLQRKAQRQATLQSWLKGHIAGLTHVVDIDPYPYVQEEKTGNIMGMRQPNQTISLDEELRKMKENTEAQKRPLKEMIQKMDQELGSGLARIEQIIRELLQIEIAWTSIREAKSIKRLTWITEAQVEPHLEFWMKRLINPRETLNYTTPDDGQKYLKSGDV
ncbi:ankyrin repeat domain-containing protein [Aspergillus thermomutatus]|uniref:Uncharacterized protein n=1 Tax=Aspergillus thermomutatus TaxID=41047 RepID=A0A397GFL6_ASPTH|nr:uncharacterized protein CDV56_101599 [Aspergillus thermomutatus]RHZ47793.1 hypothetical protein CDV56_101599 [Aspergillus thermomutatus]